MAGCFLKNGVMFFLLNKIVFFVNTEMHAWHLCAHECRENKNDFV